MEILYKISLKKNTLFTIVIIRVELFNLANMYKRCNILLPKSLYNKDLFILIYVLHYASNSPPFEWNFALMIYIFFLICN